MYASADDRPPSGEQHVYDWPTSIALAVGGTAAAVVLIVVFTYLVDWVGSFWSQVVYFLADALRYEMGRDLGMTLADTGTVRVEACASSLPTVTPFGMPGPFVLTQAFGVLGIAMIASAPCSRRPRILWVLPGTCSSWSAASGS